MAEVLIKATEHWMDSFTQEQLDALTAEELQSYNARSQKGDIIVVRPDGWKWGREECLPNFIVVTIEGTIADLKYLEESIAEREVNEDATPMPSTLIKFRKHYINVADVDAVKEEVRGFEEITPVRLTASIRAKHG
jgi:hypothetical protein